MIKIGRMEVGFLFLCSLRIVSRRCPAIMLAASRTARVPGRMTFLIVSIQTINDIRKGGVPCGTRWVIMWLKFLIQPNITMASHRGSESESVMSMCLVAVKI